MPQKEPNLIAELFTENSREYRLAGALGILLLLNLTGIYTNIFGLDTALIVTALAGYKTFYNSITALLEKRISADIALCVAVIAALSVGEYLAAAEAMFIVMVGETLESFAAGRTESAIHSFVEQMPRAANLLRDGREESVDVSSLVRDDRIIVRAGERIAADGIVENGHSSVDESSITGEPLPNDKHPGDEVFSGTLNGSGLLRLRVTRAGTETTLGRVVQFVKEAKEKRAPVERLADHYARFFLPALLLAGVLTFYFTGNWLRTVAVLIVACPCALILATPTAMVAAIGGLARRGILVRGGDVLQRAAKVDTVIFDKTGTITEGRFEITKIIALDRHEDHLISLAAAAEQGSGHALARVIVNESLRRRLVVPDTEDARVLPGCGVECTIGGNAVRAGSAAFLAASGVAGTVPLKEEADRLGATAVLIAEGDRLAGAILLRDRIRDGARQAAAGLRAIGLVHQLILTGDRRQAAAPVAADLGINRVEADLLPEQKLERVRQLTAEDRFVAMIGDGINDAPALAAASLGIAVSGASDITAEAAGVVYLPHSLEKLPIFFEVSRSAMRTARLNIFLFAGFFNLLAVITCAIGILGPIGAALTHQLSSFCVMMNSLRLLRVERGIRLPQLDLRRLWKPTFATASIVLILSGIYIVQPDELGVVERFGKKSIPFRTPGLHYKLPWPVERLTRIRARQVRVVEIGFRSNATAPAAEPVSYEWNVQHRSGRFESRPGESLALTGDQNIIELNAVVHYEIEHPDAFLFRQLDGDATARVAAESVIHGIASATALDALLTTGRAAFEAGAKDELQRRLDRYETGVHILRVKLEAVHPSTDAVDAFRDVSAAFEEKNRLISEAEGYRGEQVALARGNAKAQIQNASQYALGRVNRAAGDAGRFTAREQAFRTAPGVTGTRLYLETIEDVLPAKKKLIVDSSGKGRRHLLLLEDGVETAPPVVSANRN